MHLKEKAERLSAILLDYQRVAIAFSGGADSSLLLKCCLDTLGAGNVVALFGKSDLLKPEEIARAEGWPDAHGYPKGVEVEIVPLNPLSWKEFINNREDRCYFCKLRIYTLFKGRMAQLGFANLLDGTNIDDLKSKRAGLRAIHELGVRMPLVEAGFSKADVRAYSRRLGLFTWDRPSSSCLATRIPYGIVITEQRLRRIERWENGLEKLGFLGCRVRMDEGCNDAVTVEIRESDFELLLHAGMRSALQRFFGKNGIKKVYLDLHGR